MSTFATALEPLRRRMERIKLPESFVRELLVPGATISLNDAAMRWAGMPNKNERAALHEVSTRLRKLDSWKPTALSGGACYAGRSSLRYFKPTATKNSTVASSTIVAPLELRR